MTKKDIDYALAEEVRPPLYTCMKYWGKKPHNVWNSYIKNYTKKNETYLDPFTGSAMSAFECIKAGRKGIALDLNPLSSFVIEVVCSNFKEQTFDKYAKSIINTVEKDDGYKSLYCYKNDFDVIHNVKWNNNEIYEVCIENSKTGERQCCLVDEADKSASLLANSLRLNGFYPNKEFRKSDSFTEGFLTNVGKTYDSLYTKRNLYVLSLIFNLIMKVEDETVKKQLLFAFIQTVHLCTKMCVPRSKETNRDYSTSWGRSAFLYSKKQMEMNPLLLFTNNCFGKQSVTKCLNYAKLYFKKKPVVKNINENIYSVNEKVDLWYGVCDIKTLSSVLPEKSIDFILTDPPYGGLIQYLDLSTVWLSWLELYDAKYNPSFDDEITINDSCGITDFETDFTKALKELFAVLKDNGKMVLTFNNKDITIWSSFLNAISKSGFRIEKVTHQHNKRSGESNVSDPNGTSASDYYIRCVKDPNHHLKKASKDEIEKLMLEKVKELILERNEPTPYEILFNGLLVKVSQAGFDLSGFDGKLVNFFEHQNGKELIKTVNEKNRAGDYWWIKDKKFISTSTKCLSNRVRNTLKQYFTKHEVVSETELLTYIFKKYPNGLTPDVDTLNLLINEFSVKKGNSYIRRN